MFQYRTYILKKALCKQFCFIVFISDVQTIIQPLSNNLNDATFQKEFADASMSFKIILKKKDEALGTWIELILVIGTEMVIKTQLDNPDGSSIGASSISIDDIKTMIELRNQIKVY